MTCDVSAGSLSQEDGHTNTAAADDALVTDAGRRRRQVVLSIDCGHAKQLERCLKRFLLCCFQAWQMVNAL